MILSNMKRPSQFIFMKSNSDTFLANQAFQLARLSKLQSLTWALCLVLLSVGYVNTAKAQTFNSVQSATYVPGQRRNDQAQILRKCIDLPELQSYLMTDSEGKIQQLSIYYWHPLLFPLDLGLTKDGKDIIYKVMSKDAGKKGDPFILFKTFIITGEEAKIGFEYHYGTTNSLKLLHVDLDFKKIGDEWTVAKTLLTNQ